jgi:hypothetical protein
MTTSLPFGDLDEEFLVRILELQPEGEYAKDVREISSLIRKGMETDIKSDST